MNEFSRTNLDYAELLPLSLPGRPTQAGLYRELRRLIEAGTLAPGTRLPPTRVLAGHVAMARGTVIGAYESLVADGFAEARVGAGTFVAAAVPFLRAGETAMPRPAPAAVPKVLPGAPGVAIFDPRTHDVLRRLVVRHVSQVRPELFGYGDPAGSLALREALAHYLRTARGVRCGAHNIVLTAGTQQGLDLVIRTALRPGDAVWYEDPGYRMGRRALEGAGMRLVDVGINAEGLDVRAAEARAPDARAAYVTPSHQFPTGVAMSMPRRLALVDWARRTGAVIIEDDYDSEFRYAGAPLTALQGIDDAGRVVYLGTFSKVLFPGLRLGYAVLPDALVEPVLDTRARTDRFPPALLEPALAEFLVEGQFSAHLRRVRRVARAARDALVEALTEAGLAAVAPDQGLHLIAGVPEGRRDTEMAEAANTMGFGARALSPLFIAEPARQGLLVGFGGAPPQELARLARRALAGVARPR